MKTNTLKPDLLQQIDAYWRAANYLSVGQIYPAKEAGARSIQVRDPNETKRVIEAVIACLDGALPKEEIREKKR